MLIEARLDDGGVRHQRDLINFVNFVDANEVPRALPESTRTLLQLRSRLQARMKLHGWVLVESARFSAADLAGMDYVFYTRKRGKFHFIDVTIDSSIKWSLPELRRRNLFVIELDDQGDMTDETRRAFLEYLDAAMDSAAFIPLSFCDFPSVEPQSPRETAANLERFRSQLQFWLEGLREQAQRCKDRAAALNTTAAAVREYWEHLARFSKFAAEENLRQTDADHLRRQGIFVAWAKKHIDQAVRMAIQDSAYPRRLGPHTAEFHERRDQIVLDIPGGRRFILSHVRSVVAESNARVWAKKRMTPELWRKKTVILSEVGQIKCGEYLARMMESVDLEFLIGKPSEAPPSPSPASASPPKVTSRVEAQPEKPAPAFTLPAISTGPRREILTLKRRSS